MKRKYNLIVILSIICFLCTNQVYASRVFAPNKIPPVIYKHIKIVAENSSVENMGIVKAYDVSNEKLIWSRKVYTVKINPYIERDTQEIYIKEMKIENDKLIVINEKRKKFILNPKTGNDYKHNNNFVLILFSLITIVIMIGMVIKLHRKKNPT